MYTTESEEKEDGCCKNKCAYIIYLLIEQNLDSYDNKKKEAKITKNKIKTQTEDQRIEKEQKKQKAEKVYNGCYSLVYKNLIRNVERQKKCNNGQKQ